MRLETMEYSDAWLRFRTAEEAYFTLRYAFMQQEEVMIRDLKKALITASDNETALRLLVEKKLSITAIKQLLPEIVDLAVDSTSLYKITLSRTVLKEYENVPLMKEGIKVAVSGYLVGADEWHYRRIAELYELLNYEEERANFLLLCRASDNPEIREIAA